MSITKLDCMNLKDTRYSVYPYDGYNLEEILGKFYEAIKECNDLSFSLQEFNRWLIDRGLLEEVEKQLTKIDWDNIVNSELYQQVVIRLEETNKELGAIANKKFKNFITLEELGAKGDGITDDIQAFNKAMELMIENKINKVVGYGVYAISDTFYIDNKNDISFDIDTITPTNTFPQEKFLIEIGKNSVGSMANVNIKINLLDGKNVASGLNICGCGSSTFDIKTVRNCPIFTQIDNPSKISSDNVFIGNNIRQCGFGFIFRSENMSACEGQMVKYNFIYDCYYAGILLANGSHYTDIHSMLDFNGKSSCILELDNVEGLTRGKTLSIGNESLEVVEVFDNSVYCISRSKQNMSNGLTNFQTGVQVGGKTIQSVLTNNEGSSVYLDIINTNTKAGFSRNTIISTYCGGIYGSKNSINTDFIINNRTGQNENINMQGLQITSSSTNAKIIDGRTNKPIIDFDTVNRKLNLDGIELTGARQNNVLPASAISHPLISVEGLKNGSYIINVIADGRVDFHYYGYLIKNGSNLYLNKISNLNIDLAVDDTMLLKATNGSALTITVGAFITKIGSY